MALRKLFVPTLCGIALLCASDANATLMITEIVDATLPGGLPKFVELKNVGNTTLDMSDFSIGNYNNGATTLGGGASALLSGSLAPGGVYVVSYENSDSSGVGIFYDTYGFDPDNFDLGAFINGDDAVAIFAADGSGTDGVATGDGSDATMIDVYGVIGTDGTSEAWEYTDGYAFRNPTVMVPNSTFTPSEWTFGGANALETGDDVEELALILANTTPGSHAMIPEPASIMLLFAGLLGIATMRRG